MPKVRTSATSKMRKVSPGRGKATKPDAFAKTQRNALEAALIVVSFVSSALGPRGRYKSMYKADNFVAPVLTTKDGWEALNRLDVDHPAARVMKEAGKALHFTVGDGSITAMVLAGALLRRAEQLMRIEVHPSVIAEGYALANEKAQEIMKELVQEFDVEDRESVLRVARSCLETKMSAADAAFLAPMVADAVGKVKAYNGHGAFVDPDQIDVIKAKGGTLHDSQLINGIGLWREPTRYWMPYDVRDARIAFIGEELQIRMALMSPLFKPEIQIKSPEQMKAFKDAERKMLMDKIQFVLDTGCNVIVSSKTYDDYVQVGLGRLGILAIRRALDADIKRLAKATGANIIPECASITKGDLGYAGHIYVKNLEGDNWIFFEGCKDPKAVSILIRGSSHNVVETAGVAVRSAINAVDRAAREKAVFPGGGALEAELALRLKAWARTLHGKKQLAATRYAEALESIPTMLAQSCGLKPLDSMVKIRSEHAKGNVWFGVDSAGLRLGDMRETGVVDVYAVKAQVLKTATEVANTVVKVDGIFSKPRFVPKKQKHPGPGGQRVTAPMRDPDYRPPAEVRTFMPETWK